MTCLFLVPESALIIYNNKRREAGVKQNKKEKLTLWCGVY